MKILPGLHYKILYNRLYLKEKAFFIRLKTGIL
jgi:hypothetical protein